MKNKILKTVAFTFVSVMIFGDASAQIQKGNLLLETSFGNISFSNNNSTGKNNGVISNKSEGSSFSFSVYPRAGVFLSDKFVLGTELDFYLASSNYNYLNDAGVKTSEYKYSNSSLGLLPFARYYFWSHNDGKLALYGHLGAGYSMDLFYNSDSKYYNDAGAVTSTYEYDYTKKYNRLSASVIAGANYFISENVALNFGLGYQYSKSSQAYKSIYTDAGGVSTTGAEYESEYINSGVSWSMGFSMIIPCKCSKGGN